MERLSAQFSAVFTSAGLLRKLPWWVVWGIAGAPKHRLGHSDSWEGAAGHLTPDLLHPPALQTSHGGSEWLSSTSGGCNLQKFLLCRLDFSFFLTWARSWLCSQASPLGRAGRPATGCALLLLEDGCGSRSGGWWPHGNLGRSSVRLSFVTCTCSPTSAMVWAEDVVSWAGWLRRWFCSCPGRLTSCRSHPMRGCRTSPALPTPAQGFPLRLDPKQSVVSKNCPKKKQRSQCCSTKRKRNKP